MSLIQSVCEIYADALTLLALIGPLRANGRWEIVSQELKRQLEMGYRIRCDHEFETEQARQQVLAYVAPPHASVVAVDELLPNVVDNAIQECPGADGWIEYQDLVALSCLPNFVVLASDAETGVQILDCDFGLVGQPLWAVEITLQNLIDRPDDVAYDRLWRVVDAAAFPQVRVVGCQECLIEVDDWISWRVRRPKSASTATMFV